MWTLIPLGNPGPDFLATRHNLGRLILQRWMEDRALQPKVLREFPTGRLYGLTEDFQALVPSTFMNLSGLVVREGLAAGLKREEMIVLLDDKDLPLGTARFRLFGSDGGHHGLCAVHEALGTEEIARLRLGIGPFSRPLHEFVLEEWSDPEWARIDQMDAPFAEFMNLLGATLDLGQLPAKVNARSFWCQEAHAEGGSPGTGRGPA